MDLVACLLPLGSPLHLETWHLDEATAQLTLRVMSTQALVHCPVCRFPTQRIHSHYPDRCGPPVGAPPRRVAGGRPEVFLRQ